MADRSSIEWCDSTFNPWIGCTKISPACDHCYASVSTPARALGVTWGPDQPRRRTSPANWRQPLRWNRDHEAFFTEHGRRRRVFCASLADVFENEVDREWRDDLAALIHDTPNVDWLLLTKRIGNAAVMLGEMFLDGQPKNIWLGATICNQAEADRDILRLLRVPAEVRFLSVEPLLGSADISRYLTPQGGCAGIDWVIAGGESGAHARPMHPDWVRDLRDQCAAAGVPFFFKQWGEWRDGESAMRRVGKKAAGRLLDGRQHSDFPDVSHG